MGIDVIGGLRQAAYRRRRAALWTAAYCCAFDEDAEVTATDARTEG